MAVALKPLPGGIIAVRDVTENKTASGLYLPEAAKEKPTVAKVVAVGKGVQEVKVSDQIVYKEYSATEVKVGDVEYLIIKEEDVLAVLAK